MEHSHDNTDSPRLEVLICTLGRGLFKSPPSMPQISGVRYIVSCQAPQTTITPDETAAWLSRDDITVNIYDDRGLSVNRNHALDAATAPIVMIADDDLIYHPESIKEVIDYMTAHPEVDIMLTRATLSHPSPHPDTEGDYPDVIKGTRGYHPMSVEIVMRLSSVRRMSLRFNHLAGAGSPRLSCGEEDLLLDTAHKRGAVIRYMPFDTVTHPGLTTTDRLGKQAGVLRAKGAVITAVRGPLTALSRFPVEAWRSPAAWPRAIYHYLGGMAYYYRHRSTFKS